MRMMLHSGMMLDRGKLRKANPGKVSLADGDQTKRKNSLGLKLGVVMGVGVGVSAPSKDTTKYNDVLVDSDVAT